MGCSDCELSVVFTDDQEIKRLNSEFRFKDKPTDVLSFAIREGEGGKIQSQMLGDVVISLPTAKRQAMEYGVTLREELIRLLIHGILHLLGYDHENVSKREAERMRKKERELWQSFMEGSSVAELRARF